MQHLPEVMKILEAALQHDPGKAANYATLLTQKLEADSQNRQARALRSVLSKAQTIAYGTSSAVDSVPVDEESKMATVDLTVLDEGPPVLELHPYVRDKLDEFLDAVQNHDRLLEYGIAATNRLLIIGPPGTGKTSIAKEIAWRTGLPLATTRSDALVSSLLGQTSRNIRSVFTYAERHPCVLFIDEFDALAKRRDDSREIGELQRVVIALLQNLDAFPDSGILVAATNHPELLDVAAWRRFEHVIEVAAPGPREREAIWRSKLGAFQPSSRVLQALVDRSEGMSGAQIETTARDIARTCINLGLDTPTAAVALRRLARTTWYEDYRVFDTPASEMSALRNWAPEVFSIRALSELFRVSTRQVTNALQEAAVEHE